MLLFYYLYVQATEVTNNKRFLKYHKPPYQRDIVNALEMAVVN
nr:MAG TPA: hypothetical protein [Caudoviricetes sp.]